MMFSVLAVSAFGTPAGASPGSSKTAFTPSSVAKSDAAARRHPRKHPRQHSNKRALGALLPTKQVDAILPVGANGATLPASVDLSSYDVRVGDQTKDVGSCVAWAIDYAMLGWYARRDGKADQLFNPMYTYSQIHLSSTDPDGGGSKPETALAVAKTQGNDTLAHYHTHSTTDFASQPNASDIANAANFKISDWQTLFANKDGAGGGSAGAVMIETALANGRPVAITMNVRSGFVMYNETDWASATDDDTTSAVKGGHEVLAIGYDQAGLRIQNSWGTKYGYGGYSRLSWRVVHADVYAAHTISGFATNGNGTTTKDITPPTLSAVNEQFPLDQQITSSTVPVTFNWSASDPSGVAAYVVYVQSDGGKYAYQDAVPATATQYTFALSIGHSYQVAVAAKDGAGNWSGYSYSATVTPSTVDDTTFTVSSPWARYNLADTFGGTYIAAADAGAWVQKKFTGRDIALVAPKFAKAGRATVYCDGSSTATGDFYSASTVTRQVVAYCHFATSGQHTMKIVNEGTSGRSWLGIDAFAILQ